MTKPSSSTKLLNNKFFKNFQKFLDKNKNITAGDFNMVEDLSLDKLGGNLSNTNHIGLQQLHKNTITHILIDIWRKNNTKKAYLHIITLITLFTVEKIKYIQQEI